MTTALVIATYVFALQFTLLKHKRLRQERKEKFWNTLTHGFRYGTIGSYDDIINVYKGIHGLGHEDVSYKANLSKELRSYLVSIVSSTNLQFKQATNIKDFVTAIINTIEKENPFNDLPAAERNLILDIQKFIEASDKSGAEGKLTDLASLIEIRQENLDRTQKFNRLSIPIAIIGMILTIVFGVISLI